jgi:hypothetical protein
MIKPDDRLPHFLSIIDKIDSTFDLTAREWVDVMIYIYNTKAVRKRGDEPKVTHTLDVTLRLIHEIGKTRGIFTTEGAANQPSK